MHSNGDETINTLPSKSTPEKKLNLKCIVLDWRERIVEVSEDGRVINEARLFAGLPPTFVYAFEGCQDAHPHPGPLYIGKTDCKRPKRRARPKESFDRFRNKDTDVMWSDVMDVRFRWAAVESISVDAVEGLLIWANCPPFNARDVRTKFKWPEDLLVFNIGAKGRLLPISVSYYHHPGVEWP